MLMHVCSLTQEHVVPYSTLCLITSIQTTRVMTCCGHMATYSYLIILAHGNIDLETIRSADEMNTTIALGLENVCLILWKVETFCVK